MGALDGGQRLSRRRNRVYLGYHRGKNGAVLPRMNPSSSPVLEPGRSLEGGDELPGQTGLEPRSRIIRADASFVEDQDINPFLRGTHYRAYEKLGAHPRRVNGVAGTHFAVWAPNAERVQVMGDFNGRSEEHTSELQSRGL